MIEWISNWAGGIVVAVIIGTVIEMILPSENSKKYIKVVIGIYVLFTIVSPVITKFTGETIEVSDILDLDKYVEEAEDVATQNTIQSNNQIMEVYSSGIKEDMKAIDLPMKAPEGRPTQEQTVREWQELHPGGRTAAHNPAHAQPPAYAAGRRSRRAAF